MSSLAKPINVTRMPKEGIAVDLALNDAVAAELARAVDVLSVDSLSGTLTVRPWRAHGFSVRGAFEAKITQSCSVTLEPVAEVLKEEVERYFLPPEEIDALAPPSLEEVEVFLDAPEPPEPLEGPEISLFEIIREQIILAKSPFPRKEGANLEGAGTPDGAPEDEPPHPFAGLKVLKGGKKP
ncbi:MAG: DUF177 domain-containing protein [Alphaproteobacteria bacterium]|nr:MAG: DUF177 domain-containing protein [Alphaproteobacteria bacterium]